MLRSYLLSLRYAKVGSRVQLLAVCWQGQSTYLIIACDVCRGHLGIGVSSLALGCSKTRDTCHMVLDLGSELTNKIQKTRRTLNL